jgi:lysophospholipase L1-like esterase
MVASMGAAGASEAAADGYRWSGQARMTDSFVHDYWAGSPGGSSSRSFTSTIRHLAEVPPTVDDDGAGNPRFRFERLPVVDVDGDVAPAFHDENGCEQDITAVNFHFPPISANVDLVVRPDKVLYQTYPQASVLLTYDDLIEQSGSCGSNSFTQENIIRPETVSLELPYTRDAAGRILIRTTFDQQFVGFGTQYSNGSNTVTRKWEIDLVGVPAPGVQFSWRMADRYTGADGNGDRVVDYFTPLIPDGGAPSAFPGGTQVNPAVWQVDVAAGPGCAGGRVEWILDGSSIVGSGCTARVSVPANGAEAESLHTITLRIDGVEQSTQTVRLKDWLIAAIGDSYGSGEGNPDVGRKRGSHSRWQDRQCHRSASAAAGQAAAAVDAADPLTSVTVVHLSCSGAQIKPGLITPYEGAAPDAVDSKARFKDPQLQELSAQLGTRRPDALLISIGGNDIGFSKIIESCLVFKRCHKGSEKCMLDILRRTLIVKYVAPSVPKGCGPSARAIYARKIVRLHDRYDDLAACLPTSQRPAPVASNRCSWPIQLASPRSVIVTGYPDITRGADGRYCGTSGNDTILEDALPQVLDQLRRLPGLRTPIKRLRQLVGLAQRVGFLKIDGAEAKWASQTVLRGLNKELKRIATTRGWTFVDAHVNTARTHGYCAGAGRWVRTWVDAKRLQEATLAGIGPSPGAVHPNVAGHTSYRDAILPALRDLGIPVG